MSWDESISQLKSEMESKHAAREEALKSARSIIQTCSKCIKTIHRHNFDEAQKLLDQAKSLALEARKQVTQHPEIEYAGYLQDAEKELVEAAGCLALAQNQPLPDYQSLNVNATSYLNGMAECASEMRRFVLDKMRTGDMHQAERILASMEEIYDELTTFDFPDGLTGGLRRTCDALRAVIERTRSDLTVTSIQQSLINELQKTKSELHKKVQIE
jgi:translin